jgi:RNA polymerase II elongation factor ELL
MVHSQETAMHELYLRASSATKKNAPLKLYANVVGKFTVEQREIRNELRDKIRESTQDAAAQKNSRATVFMDTPPETQPVNKKRKDAPMFHKPLRQSDKVKPVPPASASSTPASKATSTHQPSTSNQGGVPVRKRLVHCLARGEKSEEELFKLLGGDRNASLRAEIAGLLDQVCHLINFWIWS